MLDNVQFSAVEGGTVSVDLSRGQRQAFPLPSDFQWTKDGQTLLRNSSRIQYSYPQLNISSVNREDEGIYTLTASNFELFDSESIVGTGSGSIELEVFCKLTIIQLLHHNYMNHTLPLSNHHNFG